MTEPTSTPGALRGAGGRPRDDGKQECPGCGKTTWLVIHSCRGRLTKRGRPGWDEYFLGIAVAVSTRADCSRRRVGALVVRWDVQPDGRKLPRIVSTGYNGSPPGGPSCLQGECPRATSGVAPGSSYDTGVGACVAVHAEGNAIIYAGRDNCLGSTLYVTEVPCDGCSRLIAAAGVARVVTPWGSTPDVG